MRKIVFVKKLGLAALLSMAATFASAAKDPIIGVWQTEEDDGAYAHVTIEPCVDKFCGFITKTFKNGAQYASPNQGRMIVIDMEPEGDDHYTGRVWRPSNDKIYYGKIELEGQKMDLAGCIFGGLFCLSQTWTRVN